MVALHVFVVVVHFVSFRCFFVSLWSFFACFCKFCVSFVLFVSLEKCLVWFDFLFFVLFCLFTVHHFSSCFFLFLVSCVSNSNLFPVAVVGLLLFCIFLCLVLRLLSLWGHFLSESWVFFSRCLFCWTSVFNAELCEFSVTETTHIIKGKHFSKHENVMKYVSFVTRLPV